MGVQVGSYRVLSRIGAGGMGEVWLAEHGLLGRRAAVKLLHPELSSRPEIVTRFFNEARAATAIADPGIVQVFDFGYSDGVAYLVMELLEGETLHARCQRAGALPIADALRIVRQVATSLGAAHLRGIVHRDLKPDNIFLTRDVEVVGGERAKILDFGIAKLSGDGMIKTHTSAVMGTPTFMSPEQCRGAGAVDQRSDVYALGCVLFAILAGTPVFDAEGPGDIIAMHLREPAPRLSTRRAGIPPSLDALIARCLEKDPALRFASGSALASALSALPLDDAIAAPVPVIAMSAPVPVLTLPPTPPPSRRFPVRPVRPTTLSSAAGSQLMRAAPQQRWLVPSLVGVVVTAALAVAGVIRRDSSGPTELVAASRPPVEISLPVPRPVEPAPAPRPVEPAPPAPPAAVVAQRLPTRQPVPAPPAQPRPHAPPKPAVTPDAPVLPEPMPAVEQPVVEAPKPAMSDKWKHMQNDAREPAPEAAPDDALDPSLQLVRQARNAAAQEHCPAARALVAQIKKLDDARYRIAIADAAVSRCLAEEP